ncbi:septal ring factor EnvC (AmiA/AmiB activator) [Peptoniphilus koenoeneniae]|uniref:Septal ring factor EnvC (AmiA/AmiB activator) n=1 Tax=Peptoniphilus koenoeneniae TaxID=507751 RepID=A0ABU0AWT3_9FIRM|nr:MULTISPECIES: MobQ family relaxase [Peptoniphilus]ERT58946.1 MobA/MobL family protein [Peptoniphilus sp. BV3C26]MDQ0275684.1 septal ring factor EnvC (AmiA/AmiB activator) [Peptoniphilus koenoeneniae]
MADSFHFSVNIISRGKGKSAVASAAYISGEKIKNEWDGVTHDYTRKEKILVKNIILPDHIPKEFNDRSTLWNKVEMAEKNSNAQLARQFIIGLPKELTLSENKNLVERFIKENLTSQGMIVDYAIHDESQDKNGNIHCHIMTIMRPINEKGEFLAKSKKEYILDEKGEKVLNKNGKPKTRKVELTTWNDKGNVEKWRENFSDLCNEYLSKNKIEKRVDHRSFKRQGIKQIPTIHLGASASAMERKGIRTEKGDINREIKKQNELLKNIGNEIKKITSWLAGFKDKLKESYKEYKDQSKKQIENESGLFNLYEYLSFYQEMQENNRAELSFYGKRNKAIYDLKRYAGGINYLRENKIKTISDLQGHINTLRSKNTEIYKTIKENSQKIEDLNKCLAYAKTVRKTKATYQEYENKKIFKESFYKSNQKEIDQHIRARTLIEKISGKKNLREKEWLGEIKNLEDEISKLNIESEKIRERYKEINHIKYAVEVVNEEYDIDLSIEIDKAIKRGEKESIIEKIKEYKQDSDKFNKKRQMTKDYYKNQER